MDIKNIEDKIIADKYLIRIVVNPKYDPYNFRVNLDNADICQNIFEEFIKEKYPKIKIENNDRFTTNWHTQYYIDKEHCFNCKINVFEATAIKIEFNIYNTCIFKFHNWLKACKFLLYESDAYLKFLKFQVEFGNEEKHLTQSICNDCGLNDFKLTHDNIYCDYYLNPKKDTKYYSKNGEE